MKEVSARRLLGLSLALLIGTAPTAAFATNGAVSPVADVEEATEATNSEGTDLAAQEDVEGQSENGNVDPSGDAGGVNSGDGQTDTGDDQGDGGEGADSAGNGSGTDTGGQDGQDIEEPPTEVIAEPEEPEVSQAGVFTKGGKLYYRSADGTVLTGKGWHEVDGQWYYAKNANGTLATGWLKLGGKWYWFDPETGVMATGVTTAEGKRYLFSATGVMLTGWRKADGAWYYLKSSGVMATGWQKAGGKWYWLDPESGKMATGWATADGVRYLFNRSGAMLTGWQKLGSKWYYLKSSGALATGWQKLGGKWYWLDKKSGAMATGWKQISASWYRFNASGAMLTGWQKLNGAWYYLKSSGAMATGWQKAGGKWYWLDPESGAMQTGWLEQDGVWYWMDGNGAAAQNQLKSVGGLYYAFDASGRCHYGESYDLSNEKLNAKQRAIINACSKVPSPGAGLCAAWVSDVFAYCGQTYLALDACDMANDFCKSSDLSKLKPGMLIAVKKHSHTWAGSIWGHVAIYIGDGKVMDNAGTIRVVDLDSWLWWYGDTVTPKWGWYNNKALR